MGKRPQWFEDFMSNDFYHLQHDMKSTKWLLRVFVGGMIAIVLLERLFEAI